MKTRNVTLKELADYAVKLRKIRYERESENNCKNFFKLHTTSKSLDAISKK